MVGNADQVVRRTGIWSTPPEYHLKLHLCGKAVAPSHSWVIRHGSRWLDNNIDHHSDMSDDCRGVHRNGHLTRSFSQFSGPVCGIACIFRCYRSLPGISRKGGFQRTGTDIRGRILTGFISDVLVFRVTLERDLDLDRKSLRAMMYMTIQQISRKMRTPITINRICHHCDWGFGSAQ